MNVGIYLFNNVELLDFAGPYEVFSVTSELNNYEIFTVFTLTEDGEPVKSVNGLKIIPDYSIQSHPHIDILIIPGGEGTKTVITDQRAIDWIRAAYEKAEIMMSVCSGARIPGILGLLDNIESTTHHEVFGDLQRIAPLTIINKEKRFIDNGRIMTSGGISAGIDLSLHIVKKLCGSSVAGKTIRYMEYGDWKNIG